MTLHVGWVSATPVARTGYGGESKEIGYRLIDAGVPLTFIGAFGVDVVIWGGVTEQTTPKGNRATILTLTRPQSAPQIIHQYGVKYGINAIVGFMDCFGLEYLNDVDLPVIGYIPIDGPFTGKMQNYLRNYHRIVSYSGFGYHELQKWYPPTKIANIEHGIDTEVFKPLNAQEYDEAREWLELYYEIPKHAFLAVDMSANVGPRKLLPQLMETFSKIDRKNAHLFIFTNSYAPSQGFDLVTHRIDLKMEKNIHFPHHDPILHPHEEDNPNVDEWEERGIPLRRLFGAAQVFIHNAVAEGCGLPQLQSMGCGIPPIAPDNSAQTEKTKGLGWLVKSLDPDSYIEYPVYVPTMQRYPIPDQRSLLKNLRDAYDHPSLRVKYGKLSREYVVKKHDWDKIIPQWIDLFKNVEDDIDFFNLVNRGFQ